MELSSPSPRRTFGHSSVGFYQSGQVGFYQCGYLGFYQCGHVGFYQCGYVGFTSVAPWAFISVAMWTFTSMWPHVGFYQRRPAEKAKPNLAQILTCARFLSTAGGSPVDSPLGKTMSNVTSDVPLGSGYRDILPCLSSTNPHFSDRDSRHKSNPPSDWVLFNMAWQLYHLNMDHHWVISGIISYQHWASPPSS